MKSYSEDVFIDFRWSMGTGNKIPYLKMACNR